MFGCQNHQCVPLEKRCNGIKDCYDGTDEYRCGKKHIKLYLTTLKSISKTKR